ncbi:MAG TPA: ABC transporter ATP-binding protein [Candidatus Limnocylindrales bacterium]
MTEVISADAPRGAPPERDILLDVRNLKTYFKVLDGVVPAVDGVSFSLRRGKTLGIVGESGSGKSVTAMTIMRLLDIPPAQIDPASEVWFDGREILSMPMEQMRRIRGNDMAMIFQEPLTSLNPVFTVGDQIAEQVALHKKVGKKAAWDRAIESLTLVGIPNPERRVKQYPHEMSGGMRQRVMIAMALSCEPKLLIADEPTTALDVTIQAQILELLKTIQDRTDSALVLITHDLGVVAEMVDNVIVMYTGEIVEQGTVEEVLVEPRAPYTMGLLESIPTVEKRGGRLSAIKGVVPSPFNLPPACRFEPRCPYHWERCRTVPPDLYLAGSSGRRARCHLHTPEGAGRWPAALEAHRRALATGRELPVHDATPGEA